MKQPPYLVKDIQVLGTKDQWQTKSGGSLSVLFAMPFSQLNKRYFDYNKSDLSLISEDIRGLRAYAVSNLPKGGVGGKEWHKLRNELAFVLEGSLRWKCEDLASNEREFVLHSGEGLWIPPKILHTYEALEQNSRILVIANTLYAPDKKNTHDSFPAEEFKLI